MRQQRVLEWHATKMEEEVTNQAIKSWQVQGNRTSYQNLHKEPGLLTPGC
jgi:hypothetical protein